MGMILRIASSRIVGQGDFVSCDCTIRVLYENESF